MKYKVAFRLLVLFCLVTAPYLLSAQVKTEDYVLSVNSGNTEAYGYDVAIEGDTIVVGELGNSDFGFYSGAVYVHKPDGFGGYSETKITASSAQANDRFGWSVAIESDVIVVGATGDHNQNYAGAVYVYKPDGDGGYIETRLVPSDGNTADYFGHDVAISNGVVVVGSPYHRVNGVATGMAYLYFPDGEGGYIEKKVFSPVNLPGQFGYAVDIENNLVVIGDWNATVSGKLRAGKTYLLTFDSSRNYTTSSLTASDSTAESYFGDSVAVKNGVIVVSASQNDGLFQNMGAVYVYKPGSLGGYNETKVIASDSRSDGGFGFDVDVSHDGSIVSTVVRTGTNSTGGAYLYEPNETGGYDETKLLPSNSFTNDRFGYTAALTDNKVVVSWPVSESVLIFESDENSSPVLNDIGNKVVYEGEVLQFVVSADDSDGDNVTYSASNIPSGSTFDSETGVFTWAPGYNASGNYVDVEFTAIDDGDPVMLDVELITITVGDVNRPPVVIGPGPQEVLENETLQFFVSKSDPDNDNVYLSVSDLPVGAIFSTSTGEFIWTPSILQEGAYTLAFVAIDDGSPSESSIYEVVVTVGNNPTPVEQAESLIEEVVSIEMSQNLENSYLANLRKVEQFIVDGKINAAINQLLAFVNKIEQDFDQGLLLEGEYNLLLDSATDLVSDLS